MIHMSHVDPISVCATTPFVQIYWIFGLLREEERGTDESQWVILSYMSHISLRVLNLISEKLAYSRVRQLYKQPPNLSSFLQYVPNSGFSKCISFWSTQFCDPLYITFRLEKSLYQSYISWDKTIGLNSECTVVVNHSVTNNKDVGNHFWSLLFNWSVV